MKKMLIVASFLVFIAVQVLAYWCSGYSIVHKTRSETELNVVSSIITTDITTIEELQNAITENEELQTENAIIVGKGYAVILKNKMIQTIQPVTKHISTKNDETKKDQGVGNIGAQP